MSDHCWLYQYLIILYLYWIYQICGNGHPFISDMGMYHLQHFAKAKPKQNVDDGCFKYIAMVTTGVVAMVTYYKIEAILAATFIVHQMLLKLMCNCNFEACQQTLYTGTMSVQITCL